jgi:hypothetical protein
MPYDSPEHVGRDVAVMLDPGLEGGGVNRDAGRIIGALADNGQVRVDREAASDWFARFYRTVNKAYASRKKVAGPRAELSYESPAVRARRELVAKRPAYEHGLVGPRQRVRLD